jgi:cytoskeletal protein RodZ
VALSMDEQRILAEIERRLAADDPGLASCLTTFRRPGPANVLRSPRARIVGSVFTVLLVAMVSLMVYAMIPFRAHLDRQPSATASAPGNTAISDAASDQPQSTHQASATASSSATGSTSATSTSSQGTTDRSASPTSGAGTSKPQQGKAKPTTSVAMMPETNPASP